MNTIVFNKLGGQVLFEEKAKEVEMSSRNDLEVIDGQHPDLLSSNQTIRDDQAIRHREEDFQEMLSAAQTMETQYGHLFEKVIVNDDLNVAFSELQLALKKAETETHWIPVNWTHS